MERNKRECWKQEKRELGCETETKGAAMGKLRVQKGWEWRVSQSQEWGRRGSRPAVEGRGHSGD